MEQQENLFLETEKIDTLIKKFSIPCIISLLVAALYNMVDQIFIGWGVGYLGNGATNVVFPITVLTLAVALMIGDGCAAFLSICQGKKNKEDAHKSVGNAALLSVICGIVFLLIFIIARERILLLFGATDNNISYARDYFNVIIIGLPFYMFTSTMNSIIRADGNPKFAMISTISGCIANLILDPIAIFVFNWGVTGAAIATIIGQALTAVLSFIYLLKKMKSVKLQSNSFLFSGKIIGKFISLGMSSFLTQISIVVIMGVMNTTMVKYGAQSEYGPDIPMTVVGIMMKVFQLVIALVIGIAAGCQPIIGYNYGAGNINRVKQTFHKMLKAEIIIGVISIILFELFPTQIIHIFGNEGNSQYEHFAILTFRIYLCTVILCCIQKMIPVFLQSIGKPVLSLIMSMSRELVLAVVLILLFAKIGGVEGALYSAPVADVIMFVVSVPVLIKVFKNMDKLNNNHITNK